MVFSACHIWILFTCYLHMYMSSTHYLGICILCAHYLQWSLIYSFLTDNADVIHMSSLVLFPHIPYYPELSFRTLSTHMHIVDVICILFRNAYVMYMSSLLLLCVYVHVIYILSRHIHIMCTLSEVVLDIFLPNRQYQCHPYIISSSLYIFYHGEYVILTPSGWCVICTPSGWCVIHNPSGWRVICTPSRWHVICTAKKHVLPVWSLRSK